jgi:transcriptional regulator with XRE-family HTH domain
VVITEKVKILMVKADMKQKDLAEKIGLSPEHFNNKLRAGKFAPEELEKIAAAVGATYTRDEYFTLDGERI